ncbi:hypothetical protein O6H91_13G008200 [Diphasiastrum complanatum]|nr:hypothetical protein O6H91_13G008200 [Diphasiastrum complanatum]
MQEKLLGMCKEHYLANRMKLCVLGGEPLETLKAWVLEFFGEAREGGSERIFFPLERALWEAGKIYWVEAVKEQHNLSLTWILPCLEAAYLQKPQDYISHLIGHEGAGSLLSLLKAKGWASGLSAGIGDGGFERNTAAYMFNVSIDLTVLGLSKVFDVIGLLHQYLKMLREIKPQEWVFQELQSMGIMEFKFAEEESADDYVVHLAMNMHLYPERHIIYGDYAFEDWDPKSIEDLLVYLNPKNMRIDILTKSFNRSAQGVLLEPWFGVPYTVESVSSDLLAIWENPSEINPSLHIPERNEFIPHDFTIHCGKKNYSTDVPFLLVEDPALKVWYKLDQAFKTPRANVYLLLTCKSAQESVKAAVSSELFIKLVRDALNETLYLANVAKLESSISVSGDKLELKLFGFNEKLPVLARKITEVFCKLKPSSERFQVIKEELERVYRNTNMKPLRHSAYLRLQILSKCFFPVEDKLSVLLNLSLEELTLFIPQLLGKTHLEALCHGNILEEEAMMIVGIFKEALVVKQVPDAINKDCILKLPDGVSFIHNANVKNNLEENSVLEMYFQAEQDLGLESVRARALVDLFESITSEPCFNQLRTKEQLGYRVDCGIRVTYRVLGFCFRVQSSKYDPSYLQKRVDAFIARLHQLLEHMEEDEFASYRDALIAEKLEKDHSLLDETDSYWGQILDRRYLFDARKLEAASLRDLQRKDVLDWYNHFLNGDSKFRRRLIIHVWGCKMHQETVNDVEKLGIDSFEHAAVQEIVDIQKFKSVSDFYPPFY